MRAYDPNRNKRLRATPFDTLPMKVVTVLMMVSFVVAGVAVFTAYGYRSFDPVWPPAARLFYFPAVMLLINGIWCALSLDAARRCWGATGRGVGVFMATLGVAMLGGAIEYDDPSHPWLLLLVPFGVSVIGMGVHLCNRPATDRYEPKPWVFMLSPLFVAGLIFLIAYIDVTG